MTFKWMTSCALVLVIGAGLASAERATALLDDVETALESAAADLAEDTTKDGKKRLKTATQSLKKLGKDTTSELGDVKLLKKIAGATLKRFEGDSSVVQPIVDAADAFDASLDATLDAARALVPADPTKKVKPAQVTKAIERAQKLLDKSRAKETKPRIAVLFKARKAADKAVALAEKLPRVTPDIDVTSYFLAEDLTGTVALLRIDVATDQRQVIDTGTGDIFLDAPRPVRTPDAQTAALRQGTRMVFVDLSTEPPTIAGTALEAEWEFTSWSPDGTVLVAAGKTPNTLSLFDAAGNTIRSFDELVFRGFPVEETFLWSPDGTRVAYRTDRNTDGVKELQVLELSTGVITEVTSASLSTDQIRYVTWAGTSNKLVYPANFDRQSSDTELMVVNADGTGRMVISQPGQDVRDSGSSVNTLVANPAGDGVLYEFRANSMGFIGTVNLDGSGPQVIATASANFINEHVWSPDGARIAYRDGNSLFTCDPDGRNTALVSATCPDFQWAPDGSAIVYRNGNGSFGTELFVSDPDGADALQVNPDLVGGGNVEPGYVVAAEAGTLGIHFIADALVNERADLNYAVVRLSGPGKVRTVDVVSVVRPVDLEGAGDEQRVERIPIATGSALGHAIALAFRDLSARVQTLVDIFFGGADGGQNPRDGRASLIFTGTPWHLGSRGQSSSR